MLADIKYVAHKAEALARAIEESAETLRQLERLAHAMEIIEATAANTSYEAKNGIFAADGLPPSNSP